MSKFKVRTTFNGSTKAVELERDRYTLEILKDLVRRKHKVYSFNLAYNAPNGTFLYIKGEPQFKIAVDEMQKTKSLYLDVKVISDSPTGNTSSTTSSTPSYNSGGSYNSPTTTSSSKPQTYNTSSTTSPYKSYVSPQPSPISPTPKPPQGNEVQIASFQVPANNSTTSPKLKVNASQDYEHFLFTCVASKYDTQVIVVIDDSKLIYKCVHEEDHVTVHLTQTFQLPFQIATNNLEIIPTQDHGEDIRVNI